MKLSDHLNTCLLKQAQAELFASSQYLAVSFYFERNNFKGIAKWALEESEEERKHALDIFDHIHKRGGRSAVPLIPVPTNDWDDALSAFIHLLNLEEENTKNINDLFLAARDEADVQLEVFLHPYVSKQTEEVDKMTSLVEECRSFGKIPGLLYHLDKKLG